MTRIMIHRNDHTNNIICNIFGGIFQITCTPTYCKWKYGWSAGGEIDDVALDRFWFGMFGYLAVAWFPFNSESKKDGGTYEDSLN